MPQTRFSAAIVIRTPDGTFRHPLAQICGSKSKMLKDKQTDNPNYPTHWRTRETYAKHLKRNPSKHAKKAQHRGSTRPGAENKGKPNKN